jgi:hypothetical protein
VLWSLLGHKSRLFSRTLQLHLRRIIVTNTHSTPARQPACTLIATMSQPLGSPINFEGDQRNETTVDMYQKLMAKGYFLPSSSIMLPAASENAPSLEPQTYAPVPAASTKTTYFQRTSLAPIAQRRSFLHHLLLRHMLHQGPHILHTHQPRSSIIHHAQQHRHPINMHRPPNLHMTRMIRPSTLHTIPRMPHQSSLNMLRMAPSLPCHAWHRQMLTRT